MSKIKEALDCLTDEERERIMLAFESGDALWIEYENGKFVGVNLIESVERVVTDKNKYWSVGIIKK